MKTTFPLSFLALSLLCFGPAPASAAAAAGKPGTPDSIPTDDGAVEVYPINHATLALRWKGKTIDVDPVGAPRPSKGCRFPTWSW